MNKKVTCKWCSEVFNVKDSYIKNRFAHCPLCNEPLCDVDIQATDHWTRSIIIEEET